MKGKKSNLSESTKFKIAKVQARLTDSQVAQIGKRGLVISGSIGCGKSVLAKYIAFEMMRHECVNLKVFDVVHNWKYNFHSPRIWCQTLNTKTYEVYVKRYMLYDLDLHNVEDRAQVIGKIVQHDFIKRKNMAKKNISYNDWNSYIIEESNTVLNVKTVKGFWLDFVSHARNFNMSAVYIMQRMADSSTKAIERCANFAFGQTKGQNDLRKIRAMMSKEQWKEAKMHTLEKHEFIMLLDGEVFKLVIPKEFVEVLEKGEIRNTIEAGGT